MLSYCEEEFRNGPRISLAGRPPPQKAGQPREAGTCVHHNRVMGLCSRPLRWRVWKGRMVATQTPLPLHTWIRPAGLLISPPGKGLAPSSMSLISANSQVSSLVTFGSCQPHFWSPSSPHATLGGLSPWWPRCSFLGRGNVNNLCRPRAHGRCCAR